MLSSPLETPGGQQTVEEPPLVTLFSVFRNKIIHSSVHSLLAGTSGSSFQITVSLSRSFGLSGPARTQRLYLLLTVLTGLSVKPSYHKANAKCFTSKQQQMRLYTSFSTHLPPPPAGAWSFLPVFISHSCSLEVKGFFKSTHRM